MNSTVTRLSVAFIAATLGVSCSSSSAPTLRPLGSTSASSTSSGNTTTLAPTTTTADPTQGNGAGDNLHGKRYCEVLLLKKDPTGFTADVYNTYPVNACPPGRWTHLDAAQIAKRHGALIAVLNGPRYWLMDHVRKTSEPQVRDEFGLIQMIKRATVHITTLASASIPYTPNHVNRQAFFTFDGGTTVFELTGPDGAKYVMQSWSQQIDPNLVESQLASIGSRLHMPAGWTYSSRVLDSPLTVDTTKVVATVIQDDLRNSYSLETSR